MQMRDGLIRYKYEDDEGGQKRLYVNMSDVRKLVPTETEKDAKPKPDFKEGDPVAVPHPRRGRPDRRGRIKAMYERFVVVKFPQGYRECFPYDELKKRR